MSQGVGRMFCLPKTAWPPTSKIAIGFHDSLLELIFLLVGFRHSTVMQLPPSFRRRDGACERTEWGKSDRSHVVL